MSTEQDEGLEEERRLAYVGITRAMEELYDLRRSSKAFNEDHFNVPVVSKGDSKELVQKSNRNQLCFPPIIGRIRQKRVLQRFRD